MQGIWIYSEDKLCARQLLSAGLQLKAQMGQAIGVITLESSEQSKLIELGADEVVVLKGDNLWPESCADQISQIISEKQVAVLLAGGTLRGKDTAAKVASALNAGLITDAQSITAGDQYLETTRLMYGGLAVCTEQAEYPVIVTIPPRAYAEPLAEPARRGNVQVIEVKNLDARIMVKDVCPIVKQGADIAAAGRIVCVGRGIAQKEGLALAEELASALGAEIACTRGIAEDYHWLPEERYIGISGQKVKPEVYIGMGVSGQVQHVAGIRDAKIIVAIDTNEKAPIFEAADYGIVGDLYEVVPMLAKALANK